MLAAFSSPAKYPLASLTREKVDDALLYTLELQNAPDNRLTPDLIEKSIKPALDDVEREWRADRAGELEGGPATGKAALITVGLREKDRFYSNGLNLDLAIATEGFFENMFHPLHARLLTFPIPTVAALNGHCFAGGMTVALSQDFRVLKGGEGKARAMMCMNEIDFGANIPIGMLAALLAKATRPSVLRDICLGVRFAGSEALDAGLVDAVGKDANEVVDIARRIALQNAKNARSGVWGLMKQGLYEDALKRMGRPMGELMADDTDEAAARLGPGPKAKL